MREDATETDTAVAEGPRTRRAVKLLVVCASLVFALLLCEAALRVAGYTYPVFYMPDEQRGYALRPGVEGWYRREGRAYVRINSDGLRDREHARSKPPGTLRIAVIGDSYAEAFQVEAERAFWSVMEERLRGCAAFAGQTVEVINFGVSGYGTAQEFITLRERVWAYAPDIVLVAVTTNNDITDNSRALKKTDEIPYFVLQGDRLVLDDSFRATKAFRLRDSALNRAGTWIRDHLRVVQLIHEGHGALVKAFKSWRAGTRGEAPKTTPAPPPQTPAALSDELGIDNLIYREPQDETWRAAWAVTERLLVAMRDEVRAHGAKFLVVTLSNGAQVNPNPAARADFLRRVGATDLFYPDLRIKALGEREGFPVVNLAPALQRYAEEHQAILHGFGSNLGNGHWNEEGHRVAGELLADALCAGAAR